MHSMSKVGWDNDRVGASIHKNSGRNILFLTQFHKLSAAVSLTSHLKQLRKLAFADSRLHDALHLTDIRVAYRGHPNLFVQTYGFQRKPGRGRVGFL